VKWNERKDLLVRLVLEALTSHDALKELCPTQLTSAAEMLVEHVSHNYLLLFVVLTHKITTVSRYARCHNETVDLLLKEEKHEMLVCHAKRGLDVIPEVVNDDLLSQHERESILELIEFNYLTLLTLISNYQGEIHGLGGKLVQPPAQENISETCQASVHNCEMLFQDCQRALGSLSLKPPPKLESDPSLVRVIDHPNGRLVPVLYYFRKEELLELVKNENQTLPVNRYSGQQFSPSTYKSIQNYLQLQ